MTHATTNRIALAARFVNNTQRHIFLTGKAGTGKTTFLHNLGKLTHKNYIIVAPTGIAALNAGGATIHSTFLLPLGAYLPDRNQSFFSPEGHFYHAGLLTNKHRLNSRRKQVLRNLDLLIIDEVSMLRADVLDAIDYRLRSAKGLFNVPFGGVQLLLIGDLFQLPPIVKDNEWQTMRQFYKSMHFFEAQALKKSGFVYLELDKIFRQQDDTFIHLLNNLRNNIATTDDIRMLNSFYKSEIPELQGVITITTHNYKADEINQRELDKLPGPSSFFMAEVNGDFPESIYPVAENIELKVGAQIMFVKNDTLEGNYFNGKLACVEYIDEEGVTVRFSDNQMPYILKKENWDNKKYTVHQETRETEEEIVGQFNQYPIKLAWAITVHKSQGLTFDKAVIDVGQAFAPGQVYVALSRLRSLDGLILRTRITPNAISNDVEVVGFANNHNKPEELLKQLKADEFEFLRALLTDTFDFSKMLADIIHHEKELNYNDFEDEEIRQALPKLKRTFEDEQDNSLKFKNQLLRLLYQNELDNLIERLNKGADYYSQVFWQQIKNLALHLQHIKQYSKTKSYQDALGEIDQLLMKKLGEIDKVAYIAGCISRGEEAIKQELFDVKRITKKLAVIRESEKLAQENPKGSSRKTGRVRQPRSERKPRGEKKPKGETYLTTFAMFKDGMSVKEIALTRGYAESTIEGHLAKGIAQGDIDISSVLDEKSYHDLYPALKAEGATSGSVYEAFKGQYSYGQIKMVQAVIGAEPAEE